MRRHLSIHPRSIFREFLDYLRGREQLLVRAGDDLPLIVISYPRGYASYAEALQTAVCINYRQLTPETRQRYSPILSRLPSLVVVLLRPHNACSCLGHHHPPGTQSRIARRLNADTGLRVGEIDLAVEAIRRWEPLPLASLAAPPPADLRFHTALLTILLHELEHLAFPDHNEQEVRQRSMDFYSASLREFFSQEFGGSYGI